DRPVLLSRGDADGQDDRNGDDFEVTTPRGNSVCCTGAALPRGGAAPLPFQPFTPASIPALEPRSARRNIRHSGARVSLRRMSAPSRTSDPTKSGRTPG